MIKYYTRNYGNKINNLIANCNLQYCSNVSSKKYNNYLMMYSANPPLSEDSEHQGSSCTSSQDVKLSCQAS